MMRSREKRVLRKTCRPKRDEATGEWRRLHKEELYDLYSQFFSGGQVKKNKRRIACSTRGEKTDAYRIFVGRPECGDHLKDPGLGGKMILTLIVLMWRIG